MANTKSAKKNIRLNEKRRLKNLARRTAVKTATKKIAAGLVARADAALLQVLLRDVASKLARAARKGAIHTKTASRKLSRLAQKVATVTRNTTSPQV